MADTFLTAWQKLTEQEAQFSSRQIVRQKTVRYLRNKIKKDS